MRDDRWPMPSGWCHTHRCFRTECRHMHFDWFTLLLGVAILALLAWMILHSAPVTSAGA